MPPNTRRNHLALVSDTDAALSSEGIQTKAERWPRFWRFIWSGVVIAGTVAVATIIASWISQP
jgi:hypothetical protein